MLAVPAAMEDNELMDSAKYRHGGRFPVMSYIHNKNGVRAFRSSVMFMLKCILALLAFALLDVFFVFVWLLE